MSKIQNIHFVGNLFCYICDSCKQWRYCDFISRRLIWWHFHWNISMPLFISCGLKDMMQMLFTVKCIQCKLTNVLQEQQYVLGVKSLLMA